MMNAQTALALFEGHSPSTPLEQEHCTRVRQLLETDAHFADRRRAEGHLTASAWVVSPSLQHVLLIYHAKLQRWLQPGGHVEAADSSPLQTALRETREETGLQHVQVALPHVFDVDVHRIPENPKKGEAAHWHYDVRFLLTANPAQAIQASEETPEVRWLTLSELNAMEWEPSVQRMIDKTAALPPA